MDKDTKYRRWNLRRTIVALAFGAAAFAAAFALGFIITQTAGPGTSGLATIIVTTVLVVVGARIALTKGVFTLMVTLFTILAIPTNLFGPAGIHKVGVGFLTGVVYDLVWLASGNRRFSIPIAAAISTTVSILAIWQLMVVLEHPRAEWMGSVLMFIAPLYAVLGFLGGWFGNWVFDNRFKNNERVRQIQEPDTNAPQS